MKPFSKILVPVDFSACSHAAIRYAADVARRYDASLTLVHAYQPVAFAVPEGFVMFSPHQLEGILTELHKQLSAAKTQAEQVEGISNVSAHLLQGDVAAEIIRCAAEAGHDLIVMGTHGRTGASHLVMGSIAEKVVRRAPCPVLTVRVGEQTKGSVAPAR